MADLKQKFVIVDDEIIIGRVEFHADLHYGPIGGGWWFFDSEENTMYLYGKSVQFGPVSKKQVDNAVIKKIPFNKAKVVFEENDELALYTVLKKYMDPHRAMKLITSNEYV